MVFESSSGLRLQRKKKSLQIDEKYDDNSTH